MKVVQGTRETGRGSPENLNGLGYLSDSSSVGILYVEEVDVMLFSLKTASKISQELEERALLAVYMKNCAEFNILRIFL